MTRWLDSISRQQTVTGEATEVIRINVRETVDLITSAGTVSGEAGYYARGTCAGRIHRIEDLPSDENAEIWQFRARFWMDTPSVACVTIGDVSSPDQGRTVHTTYVCATDQQILEAVDTVADLMQQESSAPARYAPDKPRKERREFARSIERQLVQMGFRQEVALTIIRAAGPALAPDAVNWAHAATEIFRGNRQALIVILEAQQQSTRNCEREEVAAVLAQFKLPSLDSYTNRAFFFILAGAHVALLRGLPRIRQQTQEACLIVSESDPSR